MDKVDLQRPHGRIIGQCTICPGASYTQDGHFFDAHGKLILLDKEDNHDIREEEKRNGNEEGSNVKINDDGKRQEVRDEVGNEEEDEVIASSNSDSISESIPESNSIPVSDVLTETNMVLTDKELDALADEGMQALRDYASMFGIKGVAKKTILKELKALRQ